MQTRHRLFEFIDGKPCKTASECVTFIEITGTQSAKILDRTGRVRIVRRHTLLDVPNTILYPEMTHVGRSEETDTESWKKSTYFD